MDKTITTKDAEALAKDCIAWSRKIGSMSFASVNEVVLRACHFALTAAEQRGFERGKADVVPSGDAEKGWFQKQVKLSVEESKKWPEWMGERPWLTPKGAEQKAQELSDLMYLEGCTREEAWGQIRNALSAARAEGERVGFERAQGRIEKLEHAIRMSNKTMLAAEQLISASNLHSEWHEEGAAHGAFHDLFFRRSRNDEFLAAAPSPPSKPEGA